MRFLIDENFPYQTTERLRRNGHDAIAVREVMRGAADEDILARAAAESHVVITADKDYGTLIFTRGQKSEGVLLIRSRSNRPSAKVELAMSAIEELGKLLSGSFVVAGEEGRRVRRLR